MGDVRGVAMKRIVLAGLLAFGVASAGAQQAGRVADGSTNQWPLLYRCVVQVATGGVAPGRVDLQLGGSPAGGTGPIVGAHVVDPAGKGASRSASLDHAINTKGTGMAGRMGSGTAGTSKPGATRVSCDAAPQPDPARAQAAARSAPSADPAGVVWTCRVSGTEASPVFEVSAMAGVVHRDLAARSASWSWGATNQRVAIVRRGDAPDATWRTACASEGARAVSYDLAVGKKA